MRLLELNNADLSEPEKGKAWLDLSDPEKHKATFLDPKQVWQQRLRPAGKKNELEDVAGGRAGTSGAIAGIASGGAAGGGHVW